MKKLFLLFSIFATFTIRAQSVGFNTDGSAANTSAILDVKSTSKGLLPPRMTLSEKTAIASPAVGLMVWCTNCGANGEMQVYNGVAWINFSGSAALSNLPNAPTNPVATATNAQARVAFTAPTSSGNSAIISYTVTSTPGGFTATGTRSPIIVTGLTNETSYTFTVVATNSLGNSLPSVPSNAVRPGCFANVYGSVKRFMCYNLGVTGTQDAYSYQNGNNNGGLYQWGRQTDGHEVRTSQTRPGPVTAALAGKFITANYPPYDWRIPQDNTLWLDASKTANDPCPSGFKVPSQAQLGGLFMGGTTSGPVFVNSINRWTWTGDGFTVGANLYLPAAGNRDLFFGDIINVGRQGEYWSSTGNYERSYYLSFSYGYVNPGGISSRSYGLSVRCIAE